MVSPTSVAAPCRLEETEMARIMGTGETSSFLHTARPTGAIISTVATLSIKAEMTPAKRDMKMITLRISDDFPMSMSASLPGIRESIK